MAPSPGKLERFEWTPARVALLGTAPDGEIAAQVGLAPFDSLRSLRASGGRAVQVERKRRGIAPFVAQVPRVKWTEEALGMLGKVPDRVVAEKLGTTTTTVSNKRSQLGIMSSRGVGARKYPWPAAEVEMLGISLANPPKEIEWSPQIDAMMGRKSDAEIALILGCSRAAVTFRREKFGVEAAPRVGRRWTGEELELLEGAGDPVDVGEAEAAGVE